MLTGRFNQWRRRRRKPALLPAARSTSPLSDVWGFDRGVPVDRYYINQFLAAHQADINGRVLEVKECIYATRFGSGLERVDVLDINPTNPKATVIADLAAACDIPSDQFDCFILTQTLQFIPDHESALRHAYRILRPGGVLLATVPCVSRLAPRYGLENDFWRYTPAGCKRLFGQVFGDDHVQVQSFGNVLTAMAFLTGMAAEELSPAELDCHDKYFPVVIGLRAVK